MIGIAILALAAAQGIEAHTPDDPVPRCVNAAEKRTKACHCEAMNRVPLPDLVRYVIRHGRCVTRGGLGPVRPIPTPLRQPPRRPS